ncbi:hypothetical protein O3S80_00855 [Streptomyces sp. Lzd4kr]|nr:hypothetical protein [Streptomyces sp. Lzd4kr]
MPIERNPFKLQAEYEWIFREIWEDHLKEILKSDNHRVPSDVITAASESALEEEKRDPSGTYQHIFGKKQFPAEQVAPV